MTVSMIPESYFDIALFIILELRYPHSQKANGITIAIYGHLVRIK